MRAKSCLFAAFSVLLGLSTCKKAAYSLENLPCSGPEDCIHGYACHPTEKVCVLEKLSGPKGCVPVPELCNGLDDDCNDLVDDLSSEAINEECRAEYPDAVYVLSWSCQEHTCAIAACVQGHTPDPDNVAGGCAETCQPSGTPEICDGADNDCDGVIDPVGSPGCLEYYRDSDQDGMGKDGETACLCAIRDGYATAGGDCDDTSRRCGTECLDTDGDEAWDCKDPCLDEDQDGYGQDNAGEQCPDGGVDCDPTSALCHVDCQDKDDDDVWDCKDPCLDADHDGYGQANPALPAGCTGEDCDDDDESIHPDAPELCDGKSNSCGSSVPADERDGDSDGYVGCAPWTGVDAAVRGGGDCEPGNQHVHPDVEELCNNRDDNCNGAVDEGAPHCQCSSGPAWPFEACGDGLDNDCDAEVDTDCVEEWPVAGTHYVWRIPLVVSTQDQGVPRGYSLQVELYLETLAEQGYPLRPEDVRAFFWNGTAFQEIDRVWDPLSGWAFPLTAMWFAAQVEIPPHTENHDYVIFVGPGVTAPLQDENEVFHFADFFDRPDSDTLGPGWNEAEAPPSAVALLADGAIKFTSNNDVYRPMVRRQFDPVSTLVEWRTGFHFVHDLGAPQIENWYHVCMLLGNQGSWPDPLPTAAENKEHCPIDSGIVLEWRQRLPELTRSTDPQDHEVLFEFSGGQLSEVRRLEGAEAPWHIRATIDPRASTYQLAATGTTATYGSSQERAFAAAESELNEVRFLATGTNTQDRFIHTQFTYTLIRYVVGSEPSVVSGAPEQSPHF